MFKTVQRGVSNLEHLIPRSKLDRVSWDDLRVFLACAETKSFRDASRTLKTSPATVGRRIERLEYALSTRLFHRMSEGVVLTPEGSALAESAKAMYQSLCDLERQRSNNDLLARGEVTIAVTEGLGSFWVMPQLVEFQRQNPKTIVNLFCAMESVDVLRLEADISIQFIKPEASDVICVKLGRLHIYPFASRRYLDVFGVPESYEEIAHHRLVEQVAPQIDSSALARYFRLRDPAAVVGVRTNSSTAHLYAIEKGAGIGGLPTFAAALGAQVVPIDLGSGHGLDIWLTYHPDARRSAHKSAAIDWLRKIFDSSIFPWFQDEFIHPSMLEEMVPKEADLNAGAGFLAVKASRIAECDEQGR